MDIQGVSGAGNSGAQLEIKAAKLAKSQQEQEGQAALQLIESSDVPKASSSTPGLGGTINTYA